MALTTSWEDIYTLIPPQIDAAGVHLWPFNAFCPVDVRWWVFDRQTTLPPSRHEYLEILYVLSGGLCIEVEGRLVTVHEGELFVMGGNLMHRVTGLGTRGAQAATIYFMPNFVCPPGLAGESGLYLEPFLYQDTQFPHVIAGSTGIPTRSFELIMRIQSELREAQPGGRLMVRAYLQLILAELFRHYACSNEISQRRRRDLDRVRAALEFLDQHHADRVTLDDAASLVPMSRTQFVRSFRQATGQSFIAYLQSLRVNHAKQLLATTEKTIAEVALEVGFGSQSYFGVVFRDMVQMSPKDYRKRLVERSSASRVE
jgi:AraC-like DNA-binding protein